MKVLLISEVHFVEFNPMLETLLRQSKLKMFRAGFLKKNGSYRHGKFDLRGRTKFKNNQRFKRTIKVILLLLKEKVELQIQIEYYKPLSLK